MADERLNDVPQEETAEYINNYTVYEADFKGEYAGQIKDNFGEKAYVVNILPLLKKYYPDMFAEADETFGDQWQLAVKL